MSKNHAQQTMVSMVIMWRHF